MISHSKNFMFVHIQKTAGISIVNALLKHGGKGRFHQHILDMLAESELNKNYFKFAFVRNPWDRAVSRYFYVKANSKNKKKTRIKRYKNSTFEEYVRNENNEFFLDTKRYANVFPGQRIYLEKIMKKYSPFENQLDWISDENGKVLIDFIGRFENLATDFKKICKKIGIPSISLKHINKSKHKHYTEYYNKETRKIIEEKYCRDIEYFKYRFK